MILRAFLFLTILAGLAQPALADTGDQIAAVIEIEGSATVTRSSGATETLAVDAPINLNDVIDTGAATKVFLQFIDGTELTLSENTRLRVDDFVYDPEASKDNKAAYSILKGTFLYTSGLIAKRPDPDVRVNTPYGSIGIRGTQFWGGPIDGAYGVLVNEGAVTVQNPAGSASLDKGQGTSLTAFNARPGEVKAWGQPKIDRAVATITPRNPALIRERIAKRTAINRRLTEERKMVLRKRRSGDATPLRGGTGTPQRKWSRPR